MKDYIVFFTEGFDKHTIENQKKVFSESYVSCIDAKPTYDKLIEESKIARSSGYNNFYVLWDKNDIPDMNKEMVSEFKGSFKEAGAIPYKYNKMLEAAPSQPTEQQQAAATEMNNLVPNGNDITNGSDKNSDPTHVAYNASYAKDHTATVFIWPFNLFLSESYAQGAWISFNNAIETDNMSHLPTGSVTSTVNRSAKGNWQRIIYVPQCQQTLYQGVARADTMFRFMNDILQAYPFDKAGPKTAGPIYDKAIRKGALGRGGAKIAYGKLDEASIIDACKRNGAINANIRNIHIIYSKPYEQFLNWCPVNRKSLMSNVEWPSVTHNKTQMTLLKQMYDFISAKASDATFVQALKKLMKIKDPQDPGWKALNDLVDNFYHYKSFWTYFDYYLNQSDVYGVPDGKGTNVPVGKGPLASLLGGFEDLEHNDAHTNDLDVFYKMAGWLPKDQRTSEYGQFGLKYLAGEGDRVINNAKKVAHNVATAAGLAKEVLHPEKGPQPEEKPLDFSDLPNIDKADELEAVNKDLTKNPKDDKERQTADKDGKDNNASENKDAKDNISDNSAETKEKKDVNAGENNNSNTEIVKPEAIEDTASTEQNQHSENAIFTTGFNGTEPVMINDPVTIQKILCVMSPVWDTLVKRQFYSTAVWDAFDQGITAERVAKINAKLAEIMQDMSQPSAGSNDEQSSSQVSVPSNVNMSPTGSATATASVVPNGVNGQENLSGIDINSVDK